MAPNPRPQTVYRKEIPDREAHSFDVSAFDEAIDSQGVRLIHYRSMRCPVGLIDIGDNRRPHEDHAGCSNGFVYTMAGAVTSLFTSNSKKEMSGDIGALEGATVSVTFQRFYDELDANGAPVPISISPYDRLYLDEPGIVVPTSGTFEYNMSGVNKLHFPVVAVHDLIDCNNT